MANNFNHSQLKKRIAMMTKTQSSKLALAKYILFIPLVFLMLFIFSCKDDSVKHLEAQVDTQSKKQVTKEGNWKEVSEAIKHDNTDKSKNLKITTKDGKLLGEMTFLDDGLAKKSEEVVAYETDTKTGEIVKVESSESVKKLVKDKANFHEPDEQEVFTIVEEMPRFPGCESINDTNSKKKECAEGKMLQYIYTNITYPAEARKAGIEGMAVVSFIVEKDGRITEPKILRSVGHGTDEVVLNMVTNMPDWTPGLQAGKTVRVKFHLPVRFKLEG